MKTRQKLLAGLCACLLFAGCAGKEREDASFLWLLSSAQESGEATVSFEIIRGRDPVSPQSFARGARAVPTMSDVDTIAVNVRKGLDYVSTGFQLTYLDGVWSGSIPGLPKGVMLSFSAHAFNAAGAEIFNGMTMKEIVGDGNDKVSIDLATVRDGESVCLPRIESLRVPSEILVSGSENVAASVSGTANETLAYGFMAATSGGAFTPEAGDLPLVGVLGTVVSRYGAPATAGDYVQKIRITGAEGHAVETEFVTKVVSQTPGSTVEYFF